MDIVESLRKYQCPENKGCNPVVEHCQCALMDSGADEIERLREYERLVKFIASDYIELSHEKAQWQRDDWYKRCRAIQQKGTER